MKQLSVLFLFFVIVLGSVANAGVAVQKSTTNTQLQVQLTAPLQAMQPIQASPIPSKLSFWAQLTTLFAQPIDRWHSEVNPSALTSFIAGILALGGSASLLMAKDAIAAVMQPAILLYASVGLGVVAIIFGMIAFMNMRNHKHLFTGGGLAVGGLLMGMIAAIALMASLSFLL